MWRLLNRETIWQRDPHVQECTAVGPGLILKGLSHQSEARNKWYGRIDHNGKRIVDGFINFPVIFLIFNRNKQKHAASSEI
jgi:hypothetical protein